MKKRSLIYFLCFISSTLFSQNIKSLKFERNYTDIVLTQNSILNYEILKNTNSKKIIDSLKIIDRKNLKTKIVGIWKLIKIKCSDCTINKKEVEIPKKYINISDSIIEFYKNNVSKKNLELSEKIRFTEYFSSFFDLTNIVLEDKSIWNLQTDKSKNYLMLYKSGYETKNGRTTMISGIITEYYKRIK